MTALLRERLGWRSLTREQGDPLLCRSLMARVLVYLYGGGGLLGLVSIVLAPPPPQMYMPGIVAASGAALVVAVIALAGHERLPMWGFQVLGACGTALIASAIYFNGDPTNDNEMFYLWPTLYAFYFFSWRQAVVQLAVMGVSYAVVLVGLEGSGAPAGQWIITIGTLTLAGILTRLLRDRFQRLFARLAQAASTDPLTGLLNRRGFGERIEEHLRRAAGSGQPLSLLVGDIDQFKSLNDCCGHQAGDAALVELSSLLRDSTRPSDTVARMGGEEFAVILDRTDPEEGCRKAERLRRRVQDAFAELPVALTISFGVASYPAHGDSAEPLLKAADQALYAAKGLGRNRSLVYSEDVTSLLSDVESRRDAQNRIYIATMLSLAETLDIRDTGTARHSQSVGRYAESMAREVGLPPALRERMRLAGMLHDIGKIGVPDSVLRKPGPLTPEEWAVMKKHPEIGARILASATLEDIRGWVLAHHERPDGRGYPFGLEGADIPLEAKILAVADAYEAMTTDRVYRPALTTAAAQDELRAGSGTQFDETVVAAFLGLLEREGAAGPAPLAA